MRKAVVLVLLLCACSGSAERAEPVAQETTSAPTTSDPHVAPPAAVDACREAVRGKLSSVAADVVFSEPEVVRNDRLKVQLKGTLTLTNGLGATVKASWTCDASQAGGSEYQAVADVRPG
jgi:hypothetical protein